MRRKATTARKEGNVWRQVGNIAIVNRSIRIAEREPLRVAPAVAQGSPCYILFDSRSPARVLTSFKDEQDAEEGAIVSEARKQLHKCQWQAVRGVDGATWHVVFPTRPFNRRNLYNVFLAPCVTNTGNPGVALCDHEGACFFMGHFDSSLLIRSDKARHKKVLYALLMEVYFLDWLYAQED